jgi:preprotein translocase subunit SecD
MADPTPEAAATAPEGTPDPGADRNGGTELTAEQRKAVEAADNPDQVREILSTASRRARQAEAEAKAARQELQGLQDAGKSELEKANTRAERAEARAAELERSLLTSSVASRHGIPPEHVHRLIGTTEEELETDAKALAKALRSSTEEPPPDLGGGVRQGAPAQGSMAFSDSIRRRAQGRR